MKVGSLFAGIGGIDLGLSRAGFQIEWQVEIDDYCSRVLAKHWPNVARFRDIRECGKHNLPPVDIVVGGFPCQPHSLAGKRQASNDNRDLWPEFYRIICELRPRWVLAENVSGLLSSESGRFFGGILWDLAGIGYDAEWQVLSAVAFGAPHLRKRIWLVAYPSNGGWRLQPLQGQGSGPATYPGSNGKIQSMADPQAMADPQGNRCFTTRDTEGQHDGNACQRSESLSHTDSVEWIKRGKQQPEGGNSQRHDADSRRRGLEERQIFGSDAQQKLTTFVRDCSAYWGFEPDVGRVANGIPDRVHRLRELGNAVVPQIANYIGGLIMEIENHAC